MYPTPPGEAPLWGIRLAGHCGVCGAHLHDKAGMHVMRTYRRIYHGDGHFCDIPNPIPPPRPRTEALILTEPVEEEDE